MAGSLRALQSFEASFRALLGRMGDVKAEEVGDLMEREMRAMDQAIKDAAAKIQARSRALRSRVVTLCSL